MGFNRFRRPARRNRVSSPSTHTGRRNITISQRVARKSVRISDARSISPSHRKNRRVFRCSVVSLRETKSLRDRCVAFTRGIALRFTPKAYSEGSPRSGSLRCIENPRRFGCVHISHWYKVIPSMNSMPCQANGPVVRIMRTTGPLDIQPYANLTLRVRFLMTSM